MSQGHGQYDGVSASGDASQPAHRRGRGRADRPEPHPGLQRRRPFLQSPPHNTVNGIHYGVSHGWGGNTLMYRTDKVSPAPTSWSAVFDPARGAPYQGKVTAYDGTIYIADAALYLKATSPSSGSPTRTS